MSTFNLGDTPKTPGLVDWEYWLNDWPDHPIAVTRANAADGYPRALTPLSQDLILTYEEAGVRRFYFDVLGVLTPADAPDPYMVACYGLVYLNADQLAGLGEATPGSSRHAMYQQFFGLERTLLIAVTGYGQSADRERARRAGFHQHLVKPIDAADLRRLLAAAPEAEEPSAGRP